MISSNEMKKGLTLDIEGEPYTVLEWQHLTEGRGKASKYIVDGLQLNLFLLNDEPVGVDLPPSVVMRVKDVEMSGHYWHATMEGPARLETGLVVLVPPIISPGDRIRVNTENGEYMERA
jgi:elongation factor P